MSLKKELRQHGLALLQQKLNQVENDLAELAKAAASDTKSSMGDKYETGREMITQETNKLAALREQYASHISLLSKLDMSKTFDQIESGAYFETRQGRFFISVPLGQVPIGEGTVFFLSPLAPLVQAALGLRLDDEFEVNGRRQRIVKLE